ncbi:MAG: hypothetical protein ONB11_09500, partial [candidate division KSB1 bacterium]|nr:hypothetical protein [candidate division KSB1 bacterium]
MKKYYLLLLSIALLVVLIIRCEIDHGLYPVRYTIKGKVIFFKGSPPANTDRVEVFALKEFPPKDPQNFLYLGQSGALNLAAGNEVNYEIQVSPTTYQLIAVLWKEKGHDWSLTGLLGFYTGGLTTILPDSVIVSRDQPVADSVDIFANWEVVSKESAISGRITYEGQWPEDTQLLLLAIYKAKPTSDISYLLLENVDYTQPIFADSSTYRLPVNSGVYNYVVLFWVGKKIK